MSVISSSFRLEFDKREDLYSQSRVVLLQILEKVVLNDIKRIITYIHRVLFGCLVAYTKANYRKMLTFDETYMY